MDIPSFHVPDFALGMLAMFAIVAVIAIIGKILDNIFNN